MPQRYNLLLKLSNNHLGIIKQQEQLINYTYNIMC